jgi:hypothetical protein
MSAFTAGQSFDFKLRSSIAAGNDLECGLPNVNFCRICTFAEALVRTKGRHSNGGPALHNSHGVVVALHTMTATTPGPASAELGIIIKQVPSAVMK